MYSGAFIMENLPTNQAQVPNNGIHPQTTPTPKKNIAESVRMFLSKFRPTKERNDKTHECKPDQTPRWKMVLETGAVFVGLYVAIIYTGQLGQMVEQTRVAQRSSRPFVGIDNYYVSHEWRDEKGKWQSTANLTDDTTRMHFGVVIKNFGPLPATDFRVDWHVFLDGKLVPESRIPQQLQTLNPTQTTKTQGEFIGTDYKAIVHGTKILRVNLTISYSGPGKHYEECHIDQYSAEVNGFLIIGPCAK
jgi:hypothetical protein